MRIFLFVFALLFVAIVFANEQFSGDLSQHTDSDNILPVPVNHESVDNAIETDSNQAIDHGDHRFGERVQENEEEVLEEPTDDATENKVQLDIHDEGIPEAVAQPVNEIANKVPEVQHDKETRVKEQSPLTQSNDSERKAVKAVQEADAPKVGEGATSSQQLSASSIKDAVMKFLADYYSDDITSILVVAAVPLLMVVHIVNHKLL